MSQTKIIVRLLVYMVFFQTSLSLDCFASKHNTISFFTKSADEPLWLSRGDIYMGSSPL